MKESIKAVVFDFDGTLYYQKPVQAYNLFRIAYRVLRNPRVISDVNLIRQYRSLREEYSKLGIPILNVDNVMIQSGDIKYTNGSNIGNEGVNYLDLFEIILIELGKIFNVRKIIILQIYIFLN